MSGPSVLPTYQNSDGALESLIEKEPPKEYGAVTTEDGDDSMFSRKNKVKTGTIFVLSLVIAIFLLRSVFASPQTPNTTYNSVGVNSDGFLPPSSPSSVQEVIASSDVADSIVYAQPDSVSTDVDASYIVEETPAAAAEVVTPVATGDEPSYVEEVVVAAPVEEEPTVSSEEPAAEETVAAAEAEADVAAAETVVIEETPAPTPLPTPLPSAPPPTAVPSKLVVRPSSGPTAAMQIKSDQLKRMRSDSRLAPLSMSLYTDQNNWIKTFFSKYGLVGTRFTNKQTYKAPDPVMPSAVTGTVEKWMYASIYSDPTCGVGSGTLYSVAGIANNECLPIAGFGGEKGVAFMMDCRDNGDVVMNAYNANDCSGAPISSTILALSQTCYAYSYSLSDTVTDTTSTTSVVFSCGMPDLTGMAVDKYFVSSFETGAFTQCEQSNKGYTDGQLFEAYPSPLCIPQVQADGNAFSVSFSHNAETGAPYVTFYKGSATCALKETSATATSGSLDLGYSCVQETAKWVSTETALAVYSRWSYHDPPEDSTTEETESVGEETTYGADADAATAR